jgi:hypothetical protein
MSLIFSPKMPVLLIIYTCFMPAQTSMTCENTATKMHWSGAQMAESTLCVQRKDSFVFELKQWVQTNKMPVSGGGGAEAAPALRGAFY